MGPQSPTSYSTSNLGEVAFEMKARQLVVVAFATSTLATLPPRSQLLDALSDPPTAAALVGSLPDDDVRRLLATVEVLRAVAPTYVWTAPEVGLETVSPRASWPCAFHGTSKLVAPWAGLGDNRYNTSWYVEVPLDFRSINPTEAGSVAWDASWEREILTADASAGCDEAVADPRVSTGTMTAPSCVSNILGQVDVFVDAVCAAEAGDPCTNPTPFEHLCKVAGTDKSEYQHGFCTFYDRVLNGPRPNSAQPRLAVRSMLEVGVLRGASLTAWSSKYPCAEVLGLDAFATADSVWPGRYSVAFGDQEDRASLVAATEGREFDLIVSYKLFYF